MYFWPSSVYSIFNSFLIIQVACGAVTLIRMNVGGNNLSKTVLIGPDGQGQRHQTSLDHPVTTPQEVSLLGKLVHKI